MSLLIGDMAPNFTLQNQFGEDRSLADYRGKQPVVLVFFPLAFSGVCTGELCELRDDIAKFERQNIKLFAISVDSKYSQRVFAEKEGYQFDLLADFWPHGEVAKSYGVFMEENGFANRGTFVIDQDGVLAAKFVSAPGQPRSLADYDKAIATLTH